MKQSLQTFLCSTGASFKFTPVISEDGGPVQVYCTERSFSPLSNVYEGGCWFSSTIDEKLLQERLRRHEMTHNLTHALSVLTIGCIFSSPVIQFRLAVATNITRSSQQSKPSNSNNLFYRMKRVIPIQINMSWNRTSQS